MSPLTVLARTSRWSAPSWGSTRAVQARTGSRRRRWRCRSTRVRRRGCRRCTSPDAPFAVNRPRWAVPTTEVAAAGRHGDVGAGVADLDVARAGLDDRGRAAWTRARRRPNRSRPAASAASTTRTSPEPLLSLQVAARPRSTRMLPEPVSTSSGPSSRSTSTSPEPLLTWQAPTVPATVTSALPVLTASSLPVGSVTTTSRRLSPPKKPPRWRGATTLIWSPSWRTSTSSASRPAISTRVLGGVGGGHLHRSLADLGEQPTGRSVSKWCSVMSVSWTRVCSTAGPAGAGPGDGLDGDAPRVLARLPRPSRSSGGCPACRRRGRCRRGRGCWTGRCRR